MTGHPSIRPNTKITNSERPHLLKFMKVNTCCNTLPTLKTRVKKRDPITLYERSGYNSHLPSYKI